MSVNEPLVSIVVPVYNVELYVERCIKSILIQTYNNIEVLLIDDGSIDKSGDICDLYQTEDSRIHVYHKENGGLSDARNYGIDHSVGEFIFFVDSDDWIEPQTIEKMLKYAIDNNADIVCCGINDYVGDEINAKRGPTERQLVNGEEASNMLIHDGDKIGVVAWNKLYKQNIFSKIKFEMGLINEDVFFTPKAIYFANKVGILDFYGYNYVTNRSGSICNKPLSEKNLDSIDAFYSNCIFFKDKNKKLENTYFIKAVNMLLTLYCGAREQNNEQLCAVLLRKLKDEYYHVLRTSILVSKKEFMKVLLFYISKTMYYSLWLKKK